MSARLISVPAGGSGSPLTGRNVLQFPGRFTEEMMVIGRVGVRNTCAPARRRLAQQPGFGELVQRIVHGRQGHRDPRGHGFPVQLFRSDVAVAVFEKELRRLVRLTSVERKEPQAEYAITLRQPHPAIGSPPRLGRSGASSARRDGVEG
jgi:hypothetical protein